MAAGRELAATNGGIESIHTNEHVLNRSVGGHRSTNSPVGDPVTGQELIADPDRHGAAILVTPR